MIYLKIVHREFLNLQSEIYQADLKVSGKSDACTYDANFHTFMTFDKFTLKLIVNMKKVPFLLGGNYAAAFMQANRKH